MTTARTLIAVLVYNGRAFVPACLRSAARLSEASPGVDVLVLDDCSPENGWSEELATLCRDLGIGCYRSPRNLGIPRNMNLGLLRALTAGYDHVVIANSDVLFPLNVVDALATTAGADATIGSATAWSNDVSVYSLSSLSGFGRGGGLGDIPLDLVDWFSSILQAEFGIEALDVPSGVGFCLFMPVEAVRRVGLFDPVFGRGYCEEVDWCLRAKALGYRNVLSPSTFVYHAGRASSEGTGMLARGQTTVWANEKIVDLRHPAYRSDIEAFLQSRGLDELQRRAEACVVREAARSLGYSLEVTGLVRPRPDDGLVRFVVPPDGDGLVAVGNYLGATTCVHLNGQGVIAGLGNLLGTRPRSVTLFDRGRHGDLIAKEAADHGISVVDVRMYPEKI
jgi:GT2 family glycosyltransferase